MPVTMAVSSSEVCILSPPVNWDRGVKSYWLVDICLCFSCVVLFCTGRGTVMGNDGPIKGVLPNMYKQDLYPRKMGDLGLHWPVSNTEWNGIHFKIRILLPYQFKVRGLLTCTKDG